MPSPEAARLIHSRLGLPTTIREYEKSFPGYIKKYSPEGTAHA